MQSVFITDFSELWRVYFLTHKRFVALKFHVLGFILLLNVIHWLKTLWQYEFFLLTPEQHVQEQDEQRLLGFIHDNEGMT